VSALHHGDEQIAVRLSSADHRVRIVAETRPDVVVEGDATVRIDGSCTTIDSIRDRIIVRVPVGTDHDEFARAVVEYLAEKQRAHHPESECGAAIGPKEQELLDAKVAQFPLAHTA